MKIYGRFQILGQVPTGNFKLLLTLSGDHFENIEAGAGTAAPKKGFMHTKIH